MFDYSQAKNFLVENLTRDAVSHEAGRYEDIGKYYDDFDGNLPRGKGPEFDEFFIALYFWDGWIDARNHDWEYYPGISESDWPVLARHIVHSIAADRPITHPVVLKRFD